MVETEVPDKIKTWQMVQPRKKDRETGEVTDGKLELVEKPVPDLKPGDKIFIPTAATVLRRFPRL